MADPAQIRHRTFAALRAFFGALARRQPTVLVLEDLHWADSLSLDLIGELLGLLADHPLLLLCVYRPGREYPSERLAALAERRCRDRYNEVRLHPLTADESRQMLASLLTVEGLPAKARESDRGAGGRQPVLHRGDRARADRRRPALPRRRSLARARADRVGACAGGGAERHPQPCGSTGSRGQAGAASGRGAGAGVSAAGVGAPCSAGIEPGSRPRPAGGARFRLPGAVVAGG